MIEVTSIKKDEKFVLNAEVIEKVEEIMDSTTITLINGNKYIVSETADEIVRLVVEYKNKILNFGINK